MRKIFNMLFYIMKFLLLIVSFGLSIFILLRMNLRLGKSISTIIPLLIPYLLLLILFTINIIFKQKGVTDNLFYNITCCLVLSTVVVVSCRSILDKNMILNQKYGYGIDFNFFDNFISYLKLMVYGLSIANIFFMFNDRKTKEL